MNWSDLKHKVEARVYKHHSLAGRIIRTKSGSIFEYDESYLSSKNVESIAHHLSKTQKRHETRGVNLHPFFAGLLPEGLRLKVLVKHLKTSEDDLLSILLAAGADCIGDVSVMAEGELPDYVAQDANTEKLSEVSFKKLFRDSLYYSDQEGPHTESNIPGIQDKISAGNISFPVRGKKHKELSILKLSHEKNPHIVENEAFFMRMAEECGIKVPPSKVVTDKDGDKGLLVKRFDRVWDPLNKVMIRIHQEDACQFLNAYPADKYRLSCTDIAEGIKEVSSVPMIDISEFLRLIAYSYIIANGDLHAKNISVQLDPKTKYIKLTPAYDIATTLPYGDNRMALKFEGRDDNIKYDDFISFATRYQIRETVVKDILENIYDVSSKIAEGVPTINFEEKKTSHLIGVIKKRTNDIVSTR